VAPLFKNSNNKIPSLSHKTLTITWHTAICTFHFFSLTLPTVPICYTPTFFLAPWKMHSKDTILQLTTKAQMQPAWQAFLRETLKLPQQKRRAWMYNRTTFSLYSDPVPPKPCTPYKTTPCQYNEIHNLNLDSSFSLTRFQYTIINFSIIYGSYLRLHAMFQVPENLENVLTSWGTISFSRPLSPTEVLVRI